MPKGQQRGKEQKKPKKDQSGSKPLSPGGIAAPITTVIPDRSKKKS